MGNKIDGIHLTLGVRIVNSHRKERTKINNFYNVTTQSLKTSTIDYNGREHLSTGNSRIPSI